MVLPLIIGVGLAIVTTLVVSKISKNIAVIRHDIKNVVKTTADTVADV
jgi:hypothetical protein